ncbi:glycosyltransferase [Roseomonas aerophila]|uniref:Glycosyltransferase n=1 Tax=Teichococcus aerophilus TaxID=1224513 RepID=A0ABR7RIF2_9PROT|nr:glycosyltransferase [Pseudoroseomonas aerophila]MBC9206163.1 glycosyltransferase [Pseudoroseomonas aerophila]
MPDATPAPATLFVTDEPFLPPGNGSSQVYLSVAEEYRRQGSRIFCLSFYKDAGKALSPASAAAYAEISCGHLMLPGWNNGGSPLGRAGQAVREAHRWISGDVFVGHPFLQSRRPAMARLVADWIRQQGIAHIYCHKIHALLLMQPILALLPGIRISLDLHDDFVRKALDYDMAYGDLFRELSPREILRDHGAAWLRHRFRRTNPDRSRAAELAALSRCDRILAASSEEASRYAAFPQLVGKVRHQPWRYTVPDAAETPPSAAEPYDIGFIGSEDVMNLDAVRYLRDDILPLLRGQMPGLRVLLAGTLSQKVHSLVGHVSDIHVKPRLEQVGHFYRDVAVPVVPLRYGTGVSIKVMEALAFGKPMVSTRIGIRGLPPSMRQGIVVADTAQDFAAAVVQQLLRRGGQAAHAGPSTTAQPTSMARH